jgi:RimJ/RimL family protein N-acetyltransferase
MSDEQLITPRLRLESIRAGFAEATFEGLSDERLYEFMADGPPVNIEALRERYTLLERGTSPDGTERWLNWIIFVRSSEQPIGFVQATLREGSPTTVAYVLFVSAWGLGYAREATQAMIDHLREAHHCTSFRATTDPRNTKSIALLEALDFEYFALRKGTEMIRGELCDDVEYRLAAT